MFAQSGTVNEILIEFLCCYSFLSFSQPPTVALRISVVNILNLIFCFREPDDENTPTGMELKGKFKRQLSRNAKGSQHSFTKPVNKKT